MTTLNNPYAAPSAELADAHPGSEGVGTLNLLSARGRIGRLRYVAWGTGAYLLFAVLMALLPALLGPSAGRAGLATIGLLAIPMAVLWIFWAI